MRSQQIIRSNRNCGRFFIFLAVFSLVLSCVHFYFGNWRLGALMLPGVLFAGVIGWLGIACTIRSWGVSGGSAGEEGAGKPVPVGPVPIHHLQAAKDLPPSNKTHSLAKD
jgi:hypothetical protein